MRSSRLWLLLLGLAIILGLMVWLINSLYSLYSQIALTAPFLANALLVLVLVLGLVLVGALIYYLWLFRQPKRKQKRPQPAVPKEKTAAAAQNLEAIRQQLGQIEDEVARQALLARSQALTADFERQELRVVIFGTGSAGKTSLINALIGRLVGEVGATMGTTTLGQTYKLELPGVAQTILITDTPGILEAGIAGTEREQLARQLATEADLLLFVVDDDIRQSEYLPLTHLVEMQKRSILVFNKSDRYTNPDREAILAQLRTRLAGKLAADDIVAIAANPQPVQLDTGETLKPDPDLLPLLKRMAVVLRSEGKALIADNILLQSQRLGELARQAIDQQRQQQAEKVVDRYQWIGCGVIWVTPLPVLDLLATAAVNAQMVVEIGKVYGCDLNAERGKELAISLAKTLGSLGIVRAIIEVVTVALELTVGGYVVGKAIQSISAAYLTRIAGKSFIEYFRQDQDWGDGGISTVVQRQFELNRRDEFIRAFVKEAVTKLPSSLGQALPNLAQLKRQPKELKEKE
jgi:uncharacterized protein